MCKCEASTPSPFFFFFCCTGASLWQGHPSPCVYRGVINTGARAACLVMMLRRHCGDWRLRRGRGPVHPRSALSWWWRRRWRCCCCRCRWGVGSIICTQYDPDFCRLRWQFGTVYVSFACDTNKPDRFYTRRGAARTLEGAAVINRNASKLTRLILLHDKQLRLGKKKTQQRMNANVCVFCSYMIGM